MSPFAIQDLAAGATTGPAQAAALQRSTQALLDQAPALVLAGAFAAGYRLLGAPLSALWTEARGCGQAEPMRAWCQQHPLHALAQLDPYTHRARRGPAARSFCALQSRPAA